MFSCVWHLLADSDFYQLRVNGKNYVQGEGMEDTFIDIANYGIIGLLVGRDKWKK